MFERIAIPVLLMVLTATSPVMAQTLGEPDRGQPGDAMIQNYLAGKAAELHARFPADLQSAAGASADTWRAKREQYQQEYFDMLGLWPLPTKTSLQATTTHELRGDGYVVEMLHYQSRPRLYVTANLYRPEAIDPGQRLPAILYVCGHAGRGRNGNKTAFQSHGIWFARHGYVCLVVDTLQLGEIAAIHHGTYREGRWWWHARGYTPAGVECWNGVRGIDYLISRPDVDRERIGVTGISGGGAATFWIAAADQRVKVVVPVSGMADLPSYVSNRVINGHCDCMFLYNTYQWPWTRIAALVAPRPLLFVNSDQDSIFPMDANQRVINRLERLYSLYGAGDQVDAVVSIGGHAYRQDIRQAAFRFLNTHLKGDSSKVEDSEEALVGGSRTDPTHPHPPEQLRVFPLDADIPADELNTTIDEHFVPVAQVSPPEAGEFADWKAKLLSQFRQRSLRALPARVPAAKPIAGPAADKDSNARNEERAERLETEPGIAVRLRRLAQEKDARDAQRILLVVVGPDWPAAAPKWLQRAQRPGDAVFLLETRGVGATRWTTKNPPNYVERSHVLLGLTVAGGRVWDVAAAARYLSEKHEAVEVQVIGEGGFGLLGAYAALLEPSIVEVFLEQPPLTHRDPKAPCLLNASRVAEIPHILGMLAPKRLTISGASHPQLKTLGEIYSAANSAANLKLP